MDGTTIVIRTSPGTELAAADLVARTHATGVQPWAPSGHGSWLRLIPTSVTGRRIVPGEPPPAVDPRAYL